MRGGIVGFYFRRVLEGGCRIVVLLQAVVRVPQILVGIGKDFVAVLQFLFVSRTRLPQERDRLLASGNALGIEAGVNVGKRQIVVDLRVVGIILERLLQCFGGFRKPVQASQRIRQRLINRDSRL